MALAVKYVYTPPGRRVSDGMVQKRDAAFIAAIKALAGPRNHNYMPRLIGAY